jgi:hypothetical protein
MNDGAPQPPGNTSPKGRVFEATPDALCPSPSLLLVMLTLLKEMTGGCNKSLNLNKEVGLSLEIHERSFNLTVYELDD